MKFKKYIYNQPELLPLSEPFYLENYDEIVTDAGFNPQDEEVIMCELTEDWNDHSVGSLVITGLTVTGHPFTIFRTLETQSGEYIIYHSVNSKHQELHEKEGWYFEPSEFCEIYQDTFSTSYDSMTNALQAAYEYEAENMND